MLHDFLITTWRSDSL